MKQLNNYICGITNKTEIMNKYYSAIVKIKDRVNPVIGLMIKTDRENIEAIDEYKFYIQRYFGAKKILRFREIDEKTYHENTNIKINQL